MKTLIKQGEVINPHNGFHQVADVLIEDGKIIKIAKELDGIDAIIIDASGCIVAPGLIDIHVHLRDPGFPKKETMATGTRAEIMGLSEGKLEKGEAADIPIIDPNFEWTVDPDKFFSKSRNTPFTGMKLKGKTVLTMMNGQIVYDQQRNGKEV